MSKALFDLNQYLIDSDRVMFGKYYGLTWLDVLATDPNYIVWCVGNTDHRFSPTLVVSAIQQDYAQRNAKKFSQESYNKKYHQKPLSGPNYADDWDDDIPF